MSTLAFYAQFTKNLVGVNSLTVAWDVEQITRSDGTRSALVTAGATSIAIGRRGLYGYLLAAADTKLYDYVATAITAGDVDQKEIAALWTMYEADGLKLAGQTVTAAAGVTFPTSIASPTNITAGTINSVSSTISANLVQIEGETVPVDNLVLALGTGGLVEKLNSMLEAAGLAYRFTAEALAEAPSGSGLTAQQMADAVNNLAPTGTPDVGSIGHHLDDILEDTSTTLPALVSGLDGATVEVVSAVSGGTITVYVADTWRFTVLSDALSLDGYEKLGLVVKRGERATDNEALLYLRSDTGLIRIEGAPPVSAANGSLVKTATSFTGVVAVAETQSVRAGQYQWWLKGFDTSPDPDEATTLAIGDFVLKTAGLQAVL